VSSTNPSSHNDGLTLRQAALIAGFGYLLSPVTTPEFTIMPKLVIPGNIEQTAQNISAHQALFVAAILCYLITFIEDVVIAWALYYLLAPVNRSMSLLTTWFRLIYTAVVLTSRLAKSDNSFSSAQHARLTDSLRILTTPCPGQTPARFVQI
jgi:branched-subunit amino acid permease